MPATGVPPSAWARSAISDVRVREVRVQRVDYLLGFLLFQPERVAFLDRAERLVDRLLGAHCIFVYGAVPLKCWYRGK